MLVWKRSRLIKTFTNGACSQSGVCTVAVRFDSAVFGAAAGRFEAENTDCFCWPVYHLGNTESCRLALQELQTPVHTSTYPSVHPTLSVFSPPARIQIYRNILAQSCQTRLSSPPWVNAADMAAQTFAHISSTKPSDGFLPPAASSEGSEYCGWGSSVCVCEENESNGAQKRPVMHREGGDGGASKCLCSALQHTHTVCV